MDEMMGERIPQVSIIMPIYNVEAYLDQSLSSARNQSLEDIEILCLDDGSTDGSAAIVERHAAQDPRVRLIRKPNEGYGATCNRGIEEARGLWIAILEPDDWVDPGMYESMLGFARDLIAKRSHADGIGSSEPSTMGSLTAGHPTAESPAAGSPATQVPTAGHPAPPTASEARTVVERVYGDIDVIKTPYWREVLPDTPQHLHLNCNYRGRIHPGKQPFIIDQAPHLLAHHPSIWSALYRRDFLDRHGIRFLPIPGSGWADNPFLYQTLLQARDIAYLDKPFYHYREESPEDALAFLRRNPELPFERWGDMKDAADRVGVADPVILEDLNRTGFTYLEQVRKALGGYEEDALVAAGLMFRRMEADLVLADEELSDAQISLFCALTDIPEPADRPRRGRLAELGKLGRHAAYTLKENGLKGVMYELRRYRGR